MNIHEAGLARRDFLRTTGLAGLALTSNTQRCLADALGPDPAAAKAATIPGAEIIVGLDIGMSQVRVAVGERQSDGAIKILGVGQARSRGILSGEVVDSEAAVKCVREALVDAEVRTDVMIGRTHLAIFVGPDIHRVGDRINDCLRCIKEVGVEVDDIALRPLGSARAVLDLEQEKGGALVIDIGAGATSYIVLAGGRIKSWGVRDVGGDFITGPEYSCAIGLLKLGAIRTESPGHSRRRYFWIIPECAV